MSIIKSPLSRFELDRLRQRLYNARQRCFIHGSAYFPNYGGRGIGMCPEWQRDGQAFVDWAMASGYRPELTLDRTDNDRGYEPSNCRWATPAEQARNRRSTVLDTIKARVIRAALDVGIAPQAVADAVSVDVRSVYRVRYGGWRD